MKKIIIIAVVIVLIAGGYIIFTLQSGEELNEASPLEESEPQPEKIATPPSLIIQDKLDTMDKETMEDFMEQVAAMKEDVMEKAEPMATEATLIAEGDFMKRFHSVKGKALLIDEGDKKTLRFEDFETDNGPLLHIYLSSDLGDDDFIDLGKIRATKGNVNYEIDASVDTDKYNKVLVWCVPFKVLFSYAELN